jgi:hypothetical protein
MFNTEGRYGSKDVMLTEMYRKLFRAEIELDNLYNVMSGLEENSERYKHAEIVLTTKIDLLNELICIRTNGLRGQ